MKGKNKEFRFHISQNNASPSLVDNFYLLYLCVCNEGILVLQQETELESPPYIRRFLTEQLRQEHRGVVPA